MLKTMSDEDYPSSGATAHFSPSLPKSQTERKPGPVSWVRDLLRRKVSNANNLQEAIDDFIEELNDTEMNTASADSQKTLIGNILKTHDLRVSDVMVPRADIVALELESGLTALAGLFKEDQFSRFPVYKDNLDNVVGFLHIKDVLACFLEGRTCDLQSLLREATIVSSRIPVMELFMTMRQEKKHMALVVDEHGGIDGLVTVNDVIEALVGEIDDEFDNDEEPQIIEKEDGSLIADARVDIEEFEENYGAFLTAEEREDVETLAGLAFHLVGRIPKRGEKIEHSSGIVIEVLDANSRRVNRVRLRNVPHNGNAAEV